MSVYLGMGTEDLSPLALATEAPQIIEADLMLPLQVPSPTFSSPKVAASPDPRGGSMESGGAALSTSAAGVVADPSKSVPSPPAAAGSSSSSVAAEELVGTAQLPLGETSQVMLRPVLLPSRMQKTSRRRLRRTILTVEGPKDLLPLETLSPESESPKPAPAAPSSSAENPEK